MRRQYLVALVAALLGIGSAGQVVLAQPLPTSPMCRTGYVPIPSATSVRLCISLRQGEFPGTPKSYQDAIVICTNGTIGVPSAPPFPSGFTGRIATWEDFTLLYFTAGPSLGGGFELFNANGSWLGNITGDGVALIASRAVITTNDRDIKDFDSERTRNPRAMRTFFCAHDPMPVVLAQQFPPCQTDYLPIPPAGNVRLCISPKQPPKVYQEAIVTCKNGAPPSSFPSGFIGRIATLEDLMLFYDTAGDLPDRVYRGFACSLQQASQQECWLGNITGDGLALVVSRPVTSPDDPNIIDFDSERNRNTTRGNARFFFCAHDPRVVD